jgi:rfaE bifunctional protein nucleotidyltransferase chain/domain
MLSIEEKILKETDELSPLIKDLPRPLVFTNGCFDILHRGHVSYLEEAAQFGNSLIVAVNTDNSVRRQNKGSDRPINPLPDRLALLAALQSVNLVIPFDTDTPLNLIQVIQPDILVKGGDWPIEEIVGAREVIEHGGEVHSIPFRFQRSTSDLIKRIRN